MTLAGERHAPQRSSGDPGRTDTAVPEGAEVAGGLGLLQVAEAEGPARDGDLLRVGRGTWTHTMDAGPPLWS